MKREWKINFKSNKQYWPSTYKYKWDIELCWNAWRISRISESDSSKRKEVIVIHSISEFLEKFKRFLFVCTLAEGDYELEEDMYYFRKVDLGLGHNEYKVLARVNQSSIEFFIFEVRKLLEELEMLEKKYSPS